MFPRNSVADGRGSRGLECVLFWVGPLSPVTPCPKSDLEGKHVRDGKVTIQPLGVECVCGVVHD